MSHKRVRRDVFQPQMEGKVCLADRIKQYIDFGLANLPKNDDVERKDELQIKVNDLYQQIRGDLFLNGRDPRVVAGALLFIAAIVTEHLATQMDIANTLGVSAVSIRSTYMKMKVLLNYD